MSSKGEIKWQEPDEWKEQMTCEERTEGPEMSRIDAIELIKRQMGSIEPSWDDFCKFGHGYLLSFGDDKLKPSCKVAKQIVAEGTEKARYHILLFEMEEEMNKTEVVSQNFASAEPVPQTVLWDENMSEEERGKWINGLQTELDNMSDKNVLLPVTRDEAKTLWSLESTLELPTPVPSKLVLTRKPMLEMTSKETSAGAAATAAAASWNAKVRLVACGNFQEDTTPHMLENYSANPSQELLRLMLAMLARHPSWNALVLDVSCAFLNALLGDEKVLIRPPPALVRLGLVAPNILWIALRAIYGLRKAPKLWEQERNLMLDHRVLKSTAGSDIGDVIMVPLESGAWMLQSEGACVGLFMMYVDDGLLVAPKSCCSVWAVN